MTQYNAAGLRNVYFNLCDANGNAVGGIVKAAVGASADPYLLNGAFSLPSLTPEPNRIYALGDDTTVSVYQFTATELPGGVFQTSAEDQALIAVAQGTNVITLGGMSFGLENPGDQLFQKFFYTVHKQAQDVPGNNSHWKTQILRGNMAYLGQESNHQAIDQYQFSIAYDRFTMYPWGVALVDGTDGTNATGSITIYSQYRWLMNTATGDAATVQFDLLKTPYEASADAVIVHVDGVLQAYTADYTVDVGNKQINFAVGSTPASGALIHILYGFA